MQHYFIRITLSYNWYSCYVKSVSMNNHVGYKYVTIKDSINPVGNIPSPV